MLTAKADGGWWMRVSRKISRTLLSSCCLTISEFAWESVLQYLTVLCRALIGQLFLLLSSDWLIGVQWLTNTHGDGGGSGACVHSEWCNGTASGPVYELHTTPRHHQSCPGRQSGNMFTKSLSLALLAAVAVSGARVRRDEGYGAPEPDTYGAPAESYGAPVESYGVRAPS